MQDLIRGAFAASKDTLIRFMEGEENIRTIHQIADQIAETYLRSGKVLIFGNGGSMCDAMHFAEELTGRFRKDRPALPAIAISDPSHITCVANDYGFDHIFTRAIEAFARPGDVVIGLSTSGNSPNVINALQTAQSMGCITIALLGKDGGKLRGACDYEIIIPADTSDRIQEIHTLILHTLVQAIEHELFYSERACGCESPIST